MKLAQSILALVLPSCAFLVGCMPPLHPTHLDAAEVSAPADGCSSMGPILRREAMLLQEHAARLKSPQPTLPGIVAGLRGFEQAFGGVSGDLRKARFEAADNREDATLAANELDAARVAVADMRGKVELVVRKTATPLRQAREKGWEMRTVCEASRAPSADCRAIMKAFAEGELASWSSKDGIEQAPKKLAHVTLKDSKMAHDLAGVREKLTAASGGMTELQALDLEDAVKRSGAHGETGTKAILRIRERCGEAKTLAAVDWVPAPAGTDPRKLTVLVIGVLPDSMRGLFDAGNKTKDDLSSGTTGSGVVVVREDHGRRRALVVTNRHVVAHALRTKIAVDGDRTLHDAQVVYLDPHHDLAVLEVVPNADGSLPFASGVTLETQAPSDQQSVIAAGYPGMGAAPSYQVTKGYVSNHQVHLDGDVAPYLQHTAPIDPGSSGGPLLSERGRLLGINTLKLRDREGVALAVPADVVADAVRAAGESRTGTSEKNAAEEARLECLTTLADVSSTRAEEIASRHLSAAFVADVGPATFARITKTLSPEQRREAALDYQHDTLGVLYWASLTRLRESLRASGGVSDLEMCDAVTVSDANARFLVQTVKGPRELKLTQERGRWTVASFDFRDIPTSSKK